MIIEIIWNEWPDAEAFSGVFSISREQETIFEKNCSYRNMSEILLNLKVG